MVEVMDSSWRTAITATLHCLTGCAIGEVLGMVLATWWGWGNGAEHRARGGAGVLLRLPADLHLAYAAPGWPSRAAVRIALAADTVSILVMEVVDNLRDRWSCPARWTPAWRDPLFWGSLAFSLAVAFVVTVPVNRVDDRPRQGPRGRARRCTAPRCTHPERASRRDSAAVTIAAHDATHSDRAPDRCAGVKVVEIAGIGPGPHACMILADLGADVIRVERPGGQLLAGGPHDLLNRGRPSVALDLKQPEAVATVLDLVERRRRAGRGDAARASPSGSGSAPTSATARNPRLVYGRMTGWGQDGPLAQAAGHDMNYIAITGALLGLGQDPDRPHFPTNLRRRLRRRVDVPRHRGARRAARGPASAARARSSTPRSSTAPPTSTR